MTGAVLGLPRIVYVAGYGRSGSTLLARLLGQETQICSAGEICGIADWIGSTRPCSCGLPIFDCPFWSSVRVAIGEQRNLGSAWRTAIESPFGLWLGRWWIPGAQLRAYRQWNQQVFVAIARAAGTGVVVDSSKSSFRIAGRARALASIAELDLVQIHLVRSPQSVRDSLMQGSNRELEGRTQERVRFARMRAFLGWLLANLAALRTARLWLKRQSILVRYEQLVGEPQSVLDQIAALIDQPLLRAKGAANGGEFTDIPHMGEGNRMRFEPLRLRPARDVESSVIDRWLCAVTCGSLSRQFGYTRFGETMPASAAGPRRRGSAGS